MPKPQRKKPGRPSTLGPGAMHITTKFRRDQINATDRMGGYVPGRQPGIIRDLLDIGIKVARARIARAR